MRKPSCTVLLLEEATRQVVAAAASAILRTHRGDQRGRRSSSVNAREAQSGGKKILWARSWHLAGSETFASERACKPCKGSDYTTQMQEFGSPILPVILMCAFVLLLRKTLIKKDLLMDNHPWKQKVAVKNVEHVVKETFSNDVAAERSETAVAPASGTWEPLVLRLLIADTGRHLLQNLPSPMFSTQCHALDILNCCPLLVVPIC